MTTEISTETEQVPDPRVAPPPAAAASAGPGRHRGPVAAQDAETAPRGRHRRQGEES
ncbi:hypothetical protein AB0O76_02975 [Streptomyces sp. NPDC086554]|uniref:hypothetical protein n=1 Tax=Streptomyces sp. NPDC086554 TaxID=3154864 RepID=UPI00343B69D4